LLVGKIRERPTICSSRAIPLTLSLRSRGASVIAYFHNNSREIEKKTLSRQHDFET
jgi:hypothetical protein